MTVSGRVGVPARGSRGLGDGAQAAAQATAQLTQCRGRIGEITRGAQLAPRSPRSLAGAMRYSSLQ
jgi:hypothetical protein